MDFDFDIVVIGAGVVGLAIAQQLSKRYPSLAVIEKHGSFGNEISSRNSEVIHAGIYYRPGSLKATLCHRGSRLLYEICESKAIPHRRTGKIIAACTAEEEDRARTICENARENGAKECRLLTKKELARLEPEVTARMAILSPSTGIIDAHSLMRYFSMQVKAAGGDIVYRSELVGARPLSPGYVLSIKDIDGEIIEINCRVLVNSAGLSSDEVAGFLGLDPDENGYRLRFVKGNYFRYSGPRLNVKRLVYPVPPKDSLNLGIHSVIDLGGRLRFGPDAIPLDENEQDYSVDSSQLAAFGRSIRHYLPQVQDQHLSEDFSGIRPRLAAPGEHDFIIRHESDNGVPGFFNLVGIESPGLTACPAIAEYVAGLVDDFLG